MKKHSVSIRGHSTSFSLEDEFWVELRNIAKTSGAPLAQLIARIDAQRGDKINLSSAIRLHVLRHLKEEISAERKTAPSSPAVG